MDIDYPLDWKLGRIQARQYERAGWRCEHCGMTFTPGTTKAKDARNRDGNPVILTVHHIDGCPSNCDDSNLLCCCQKCHLHIQGVWAPGGVIPATWGEVPQWILDRALPYRVVGLQLSLF